MENHVNGRAERINGNENLETCMWRTERKDENVKLVFIPSIKSA